MIRSLFLSMGELNKGARRPAERSGVEPQEGRRARRGPDGRRHRLCFGQRRPRSRADRPRPGMRPTRARLIRDKIVSGQIAKGRAKPADKDALLALHPRDAGLRGAERLRPRRRSGVRGSRGEGGGDEEGAGRARPRRDLRQQHLDPADHLARRDFAQARQFHRRAFLLAGRQDDADRDHHGQEDGREGARGRDGFRPRDQEDADRRQRLPRLLRQPLRRQLHGRGASRC